MNLEKLNDVSCRVTNINDGDAIPIGGTFFGKFDLSVTADEAKFAKFFDVVDRNLKKILSNATAVDDWLKKSNAEKFDTKTFIHLWCFDNALHAVYPNMSSNINKRGEFYTPDTPKTLSQSFAAGVCQCAEIALLAQIFCQRYDIDTAYFGGEMLASDKLINKNGEDYGEPHSFLFLKLGPDTYIYDPANSITADKKYVPRIQSVTPPQMPMFESRIHAPRGRICAFLETQNILTKQKTFYGCGDGAVIWPQNIIRQNVTIPAKEKEY